MLFNVIGAVDVLRQPEFNLSTLLVCLLGFILSWQTIILHDTRVELTMFKFMQSVSRTLINNATHEEIDELRRQLKSGLTGNAAKYTKQLFEKYEKKDG
jgi:uncharacterized membrane protein YciS (DUF1049 family)